MRFANGFSKTIGLALAAGLLAVAAPSAASAQGLFEALFGGLRRASQEIHRGTPFADPFTSGERERRRPSSGEYTGGGGGQAFCVRTCDGRFFPLQRANGTTPAEMCKSFCPSAKTMVFHGSKIDTATSGSTRYTDLDNAFLFRQKVVDDCTCNGKDAFGLARVAISDDPTLKGGDIVATAEGLATYRGKDRNQNAQFTPISGSAGEWARRLAETKVMPVAEPEKVARVADDTPIRQRRRSAMREALPRD